MGEIARWNGHVFSVAADVIRSFTDLSIKGGSKTEEKTSSNQGYVSRKNGDPHEISLTAQLNAMLGCDVQTETMAFIDEARAGKSEYFYTGGKKLMTCKLMLTDATAEKIELNASGRWIRSEVKLTFKQCTKNDGTTGGSSSSSSSSGSSSKSSSTSSSTSSNKTSVKTTSTSTSKSTATKKAITAAIGGAATAIAATQTTIAKASAAIVATKKAVASAKAAAASTATANALSAVTKAVTSTVKTIPLAKK